MASVSKRAWEHEGEKREAWLVRYTDGGGVRRQKQFDRKKDADRYRTMVETEIEAGTFTAARASVTVAELAKHYLAAAEHRQEEGRRMGQGHLYTLRLFFRCHIVPHLGGRVLSELRYADLDRWAGELRKKGTLSPATVKRTMHIFKVAVDFAIRRGWVAHNVVGDVMREHRGGKRPMIRTFTQEQVRGLLAELEHRPANYTERSITLLRCMVYLAAFCGLRRGEIMGLTLAHVDTKNRVIHVRNNLTEYGELKGPKTASGVRDVPMPASVADMVLDWRRRFYVENDARLLFRAKDGRQLGTNNFLQSYWRPLLDRAGLGPCPEKGHFHFHALRHFAASLMIEHHLPMTEVASLMGHSGFDVTLQVYAHTIAGGRRQHEAIEGMAEAISPPLLRGPPPSTRQTRGMAQKA